MICIYKGMGAGKDSISHTIHTFRELFPSQEIKLVDEKETISGDWKGEASLFIMPGGADLPYVAKLKGKGNEAIKQYVESGGSYLGICAGGYYGSSYVEFDKAGPLEVIGERELGFFPGKAIGPLTGTFDYRSNAGVRIAVLRSGLVNEPIQTLLNGGSYFEHVEKQKHVDILATYDEKNLPAIVKMTSGKGTVILSGVHFEFSPDLLNENDPYLKKIIPALKETDSTRKKFLHKILEQLHLT